METAGSINIHVVTWIDVLRNYSTNGFTLHQKISTRNLAQVMKYKTKLHGLKKGGMNLKDFL